MERQLDNMYELMRKESNRLKTFQMNPPWPKDYVDIKKLAKAGFFYAFNGDNVLCAFCHGQVCRWERGDDPMSEHAKHFTTCPFIMGGDVGNEPLGEDPFPGPKRPRPFDVCGTFNSDNASYNASNNISNNTSYNVGNNINYNNSYNISSNISNNVSNNTSDSTSYNISNNNNFNYHQDDTLFPPSNSYNSSNSMTGICKICYTNPIEMVFLPCSHSVSCLSCAQRLYSCPYCRTTIATRIRTYYV